MTGSAAHRTSSAPIRNITMIAEMRQTKPAGAPAGYDPMTAIRAGLSVGPTLQAWPCFLGAE
jgi:hypothetical protein